MPDKCPLCGVKSRAGFLCKDCVKKQSSKMIKVEVGLPEHIYQEVEDGMDAAALGENRARAVIKWEGKYYIATGCVYYGKNSGKDKEYCGHEVIPLELHEGPTYTYDQLQRVNGTGGYFHGNNQQFACRGKKWVIVPYVKVIFTKTTHQPAMF